nr:MAG TPA: hypothetical protein [Caudoviricetes sp.]
MGLLNKSNKTRLVGIKEIYGDVMFLYSRPNTSARCPVI